MIFEDLLMEIQSDLVSLGLEYSNSQIDKFICMVIWKKVVIFNLFLREKWEIIKLNQINDF